jgi:hypothetical protein
LGRNDDYPESRGAYCYPEMERNQVWQHVRTGSGSYSRVSAMNVLDKRHGRHPDAGFHRFGNLTRQ